MKRIYLLLSLILVFFTGCYDDKGGHDYDTVMPDVEIVIPGEAYSAPLNGTISITPEVKTDISDDDLQYIWEAKGALRNEHGRETYTPMLPEEEWNKTLNYVCKLDENIVSLNESYTCRLHVRQISTGRDFYSSNTITITIAGITGLMLLHGDDQSSDIGVLMAEEFMPSSSSVPESPTFMPDLYATNNEGEKIAGKGEAILQSIVSYANSEEQKERCRIYVKTNQGVSFLNYADFSYYGDWNSLFYLAGRPEQVNQNHPEGYLVSEQLVIGFDGDETYIMNQNNEYPFLFSDFSVNNVCGDGNTFIMAPFFLKVATGGIQTIMYARAVNGDSSRKGFVGISNSLPPLNSYSQLLDTKNDIVTFNPGNMHADLIQMKCDNRGHALAVLKGDASHPQYAGKYFAVDLWPNSTDSDKGDSGYKGVPQYMYDLSSFPDINNAIAFEFGESKNMAYYATSSKVYQYGFDGSVAYEPVVLNMADGGALNIQGEITMMKLLNSPNVKTRVEEPVLLVATWDGAQSTLYALHLSTGDGKVLKTVTYNSGNVEGWNVGRITDVNIKGM